MALAAKRGAFWNSSPPPRLPTLNLQVVHVNQWPVNGPNARHTGVFLRALTMWSPMEVGVLGMRRRNIN